LFALRTQTGVNAVRGLVLASMKLHEKLTALYERSGLSQRDVARAAGGVSVSTVNRWLSGEGEPRLSEALALAKLFSVPIEFLADDAAGDPAEYGLSIEETALLRMARTSGARALFSPGAASDPEFDAELYLSRKSGELVELMVRIFEEKFKESRPSRTGRRLPSDSPGTE
jgi:transcriptional regulator with XRE-family HTH domain